MAGSKKSGDDGSRPQGSVRPRKIPGLRRPRVIQERVRAVAEPRAPKLLRSKSKEKTRRKGIRSAERPTTALEIRFQPILSEVEYPRALDSDSAMKAKTEDLSTGGIFLQTTVRLRAGSRVAVELALPSAWEPMVVIGEVRWIRDEPPGLGVAFVDTSPEAHVALGQLLTALSFGDD